MKSSVLLARTRLWWTFNRRLPHCSRLVAHGLLLMARCSWIVAPGSLLMARCSDLAILAARFSEAFASSRLAPPQPPRILAASLPRLSRLAAHGVLAHTVRFFAVLGQAPRTAHRSRLSASARHDVRSKRTSTAEVASLEMALYGIEKPRERRRFESVTSVRRFTFGISLKNTTKR